MQHHAIDKTTPAALLSAIEVASTEAYLEVPSAQPKRWFALNIRRPRLIRPHLLAFTSSLPALGSMAALVYGIARSESLTQWLIGGPIQTGWRTRALIDLPNFFSTWLSALPMPFTACLLESMYHAATVASRMAGDKWADKKALDRAIADARTGSIATHFGLASSYLAPLLYCFPWVRNFLHGCSGCIWAALGVLVVDTAIAVGLSLALRALRGSLVRRERENTPEYVAAHVPSVLLALTVQVGIFAIICYRHLFILPFVPGGWVDTAECKSLGINYTAAYCKLAPVVDFRPWGSSEAFPNLIAASPNLIGSASWICDDGGYRSNIWDLYSSTLLACKAQAIMDEISGRGYQGLCINAVLLFGIGFREMLMGVDADLTWRNWTSRASLRVKAALMCALVAALCLPYFLLNFFIDPWSSQSTMILLITVTAPLWIAAFMLLIWESKAAHSGEKGDLILADGSSLRAALVEHIRVHTDRLQETDRVGPPHCSIESKLSSGDIRQLRIGAAEEAAHGLLESMNVGADFTLGSLSEGTDRIEKEFQDAVDAARRASAPGTDVEKVAKRLGYSCSATRLKEAEGDLECLRYVLYEGAGSSSQVFSNGNLKRDCDKNGDVREDRVKSDGSAMLLQDFCDHPSARKAKLFVAHVLALRTYTTAAFARLNSPFRDGESDRPPHPFPATVCYLAEGIKRLRAVGAHEGLVRQDFWRGMRGLSLEGPRGDLRLQDKFLKDGGSEPAPMSTTANLAIAVQYSLSTHALLFRIMTKSFMQRGVDLQFLSAFPSEAEYLFPPLTFLRPVQKADIKISSDDVKELGDAEVEYTVVELEPFMA